MNFLYRQLKSAAVNHTVEDARLIIKAYHGKPQFDFYFPLEIWQLTCLQLYLRLEDLPLRESLTVLSRVDEKLV